jgi:hypothetical protein
VSSKLTKIGRFDEVRFRFRSPQTTTQRQPQASQSLVPPSQAKDKKLKSQTYDDSLSSLSIESEGEDLLTQVNKEQNEVIRFKLALKS